MIIPMENPSPSSLYPLKTLGLIPCYNAIKFIDTVISETLEYVDYLLLFNDGSTDGSEKVMQKWAAKYPKVFYQEFQTNKGKGHALLEAFSFALNNIDFDVIISLDADGQHDAKLIPSMIPYAENNTDLVIGKRDFSKMPPKSKHSNRFILFLTKLLYSDVPSDTQSGFRIYSKDYAKELVKEAPGGRYETEFESLLIALYEKRKIKLCPIPTIYIEKNRYSHFQPLKDSMLILKSIWKHMRWRKKKQHET